MGPKRKDRRKIERDWIAWVMAMRIPAFNQFSPFLLLRNRFFNHQFVAVRLFSLTTLAFTLQSLTTKSITQVGSIKLCFESFRLIQFFSVFGFAVSLLMLKSPNIESFLNAPMLLGDLSVGSLNICDILRFFCDVINPYFWSRFILVKDFQLTACAIRGASSRANFLGDVQEAHANVTNDWMCEVSISSHWRHQRNPYPIRIIIANPRYSIKESPFRP